MFRINNAYKLSLVVRHKTTSSQIDYASDQYQYLHKSKTPMLHFQPSLPRLPIPDIDKTCNRYLAALKPLLNDDRHKQTEKIVEHFRTKDAPKLQELLKATDKANKHTSYISGPWFEMYLKDRVPLPINYNAALIMKKDSRPEYNEQLVRTANLVISTLRFRRSLITCTLKPEVYHMNPKKTDTDFYHTVTRLMPSSVSTYVSFLFNAYPLDMSQYQGLFGATRIPEQNIDRIYRDPNTRHIIVLKDSNFYAVDVLDTNGYFIL